MLTRVLKTVDSTNLEAKRWIAEGAPHGAAVLADMQTEGRGRRGRFWVSPAEAGLWTSIILYIDFPAEHIPLLTFAAAMAASDACYAQGAETKIKWPNDLMAQGKKVCGILSEVCGSYVVVGIGMNLRGTREMLPPECRDSAGFLEMLSGVTIDRMTMLEDIRKKLLEWKDVLSSGDVRMVLESYRVRCATLGSPVWVQTAEKRFAARALDITDEGALLVRTERGEISPLFAGDVSIRYES